MRFTRLYSTLPRPNLDIKSILANYSRYHDSIIKRELSPTILHNLESLKENRTEELNLNNELNKLKHERNTLSKTMNKENRESIIETLTEFKSKIKGLEDKLSTLSEENFQKAESLPNLIDESVKATEDIVEYLNYNGTDNLPTTEYDHKVIGEKKGIMDFNSGAKVSGNSWYYLIGDGAMLEQALINYTLQMTTGKDYKMVIPPTIVRNEIINGCGFKPNDQNNEQQIYEISNSDLSLIGTSEIPLAGLHVNSNINYKSLPVKYVGLSRAFRAEAGARGKDTKGLYRVHEFTKVELFHFTKPENSVQELEDIVSLQKNIINNLGLKAKVINIPYNDLGSPAFKKYDIEAWMPGRQAWGELTSTSNCTDYQSRRLTIKYTDEMKKNHYLHTLNGTAMAIPRVIVAIIEQFYDPVTDKIAVPKVLQPFMGKEFI